MNRQMRWLALCALFGVIVGPLWASPKEGEVSKLGKKRLAVTVLVDFGPAGRPAREEILRVDQGSTPKDVISLIFPVQSGEVCCDTRELIAIDGVWANPERNRWWTCALNGTKHVSPFKTKLKTGDRVEWRYLEESQ